MTPPVSFAEIKGLLPPSAASAACDGDLEQPQLFPEEEALVVDAVASRRLEFATGRECARAALTSLGAPPAPILADNRGAPRWPDAVVGSITHCDGLRAAAVAWRADLLSLGIDAEPNAPLPGRVLGHVALDRERAALSQLLEDRPTICWDRLLFSAKEAVYKAWYQLTQCRLGFDDVHIAFDPGTRTFSARPQVVEPSGGEQRFVGFYGRWQVRKGLLVSSAIASTPDRSRSSWPMSE